MLHISPGLLPHLTNPLYQRLNLWTQTEILFLPQLTNVCRKTFIFSIFQTMHFPKRVSVKSLTITWTTKITQNQGFSNTANNVTKMHRKTFYFRHVSDSSKMVHGCEHVSVKSLTHTQKSVITFFSVGNIQDDQTHLFQICMPVNQGKNVALIRHFII